MVVSGDPGRDNLPSHPSCWRVMVWAGSLLMLAACATMTYPDGRKAKAYFPMEIAADGTIRPNGYAVDIVTTAAMQASPYLIDKAVNAIKREDVRE